MFRDIEVTSDRTPSIHIGSDDNLSSHSRLGYSSNILLVSDRESAFDPSLEEVNPLG